MNYVLFAYSFPPRCGAETFCSARFASALAGAGHNVTVVTMDHPWDISRETYDFLVDPRLKIVRVPLADKSGRIVLPRLRYRMAGREAVDVQACVNTLAATLDAVENPVLVTRSMPEISDIVGWYCRRHARKWIAHFSDPFPWLATGLVRRLSSRFFRNAGVAWGRRIIRDADVVSVTCDAAKRFFEETYGDLFRGKKTIVTAHIGEPPLPSKGSWKRDCAGTLVVHTGYLGLDRGAREMLDAVAELKAAGADVSFLQVGTVDKGTMPLFGQTPGARIYVDSAPDTATAVAAVADVVLIPDTLAPGCFAHTAYSPFLRSKFVYQLFSDVPIVAWSLRDSEMARLAERFPEAGVVFADMEEKGSLARAVRRAAALDRRRVDRSRIRRLFTRETVSALYA